MATLRIEVVEDMGLYDYTVDINQTRVGQGECYRLSELALGAAYGDYRAWARENFHD